MKRREFFQAAAALIVPLSLKTRAGEADSIPAYDELDVVLHRAAMFLVERQQADGSWRSEIYGGLRDGASLTPLVVQALHSMPKPKPAMLDAIQKGKAFLSDALRTREVAPLTYPVYTLSMAIEIFARDGSFRDELLARLLDHQFTERLGWSESDPRRGGWGYEPLPPVKPDSENAAEFPDANISATAAAILALRAAGIRTDDPAIVHARRFVERCQNYSPSPDSKFDDGGFFFSPTDAARNKAGAAGKDSAGRARFHSYGGATADGLRALLAAGASKDDPRPASARSWAESNLTFRTNPGRFEADREFLREATYFYYCRSLAAALNEVYGRDAWTSELIQELFRRQNANGSWTNRATDAKEDDPLVATPLALLALTRATV